MSSQTQSKIKRITFSLLVAAILGVAAIVAPNKGASAAGSSTLSLSPTSGTYTVGDTFNVQISENSGSETVNSYQAYVKYDHNVLQAISGSITDDTFDSGPQISTNGTFVFLSHGIGSQGVTTTGSHQIGTVNFKVIGTSTSSPLSFDASSLIINPNTGGNVWNGNTNAAASYALKAAVVTPPPSGGGSTGGGSTGSTGSTGSSSSSSGSKSTASGGSTKSTGSSNKSTAPTTSTPTSPAATTTPTESNPQSLATEQTYNIAIKVNDTKNKPIVGAVVKLGDQTTKTLKTGVASFTDVPAGSYDVKVTYKGKTQTQKFTVNTQDATTQNLQAFNVKFTAHSTPTWPIYIIVLLFIVGLGSAGFILPRKNKFHPPSGGGSGGGTIAPETMVVGDISKSSDPDPTHVGQIIKPTIKEEK